MDRIFDSILYELQAHLYCFYVFFSHAAIVVSLVQAVFRQLRHFLGSSYALLVYFLRSVGAFTPASYAVLWHFIEDLLEVIRGLSFNINREER